MNHRSRIQGQSKFIISLKVIGILLIGIIALGVIFIGPLFFRYAQKGIHLKQTANQRITILLLGIGGGTHDGPLLTDTMIFASVDPNSNQMDLVSIPRDLWNSDISQKINATYALAEQNKTGSGLQAAKSEVSKVVGEPITYGFRIDFGGFVKAVDAIGGLDVNVARTLDDYKYPIDGSEDDTCGFTQQQVTDLSAQIATGSASSEDSFPCRYKHLHVDPGLQHMDGETALEFVRSRHALGSEGSDFARSARQQLVIEAFRNKLLSTQTLLDPVKMLNLYSILKSSIDTDISQDEIPDFIKLAQQMKTAQIHSFVIDYTNDPTDEGNFLIQGDPSLFNGAYVLMPRVGMDNYSQIQAFVACKVQNIGCPTPTPNPLLSPTKVLKKQK
ncbi:MAG TPA: LCP family protein [Patescibacteria group bacterium]|nr:LCP family protein [Patescibacteria group bacterium]